MRTIRSKLILAISSVVFIVLVIVMGLIETINRNNVIENSFNTLRALREIKATQVQDYIEISRNQIITMSENLMVIEAMNSFKSAFQNFSDEAYLSSLNKSEIEYKLNEYYGDNFLPRLTPNIDREVFASNFIPSSSVTRALQYTFIADNPNPTGEKQKLNSFANFAELALNPGKLASRIELLISPALKDGRKGRYLYFIQSELSSFQVDENIDDNQSEGCGC